MLEMLYTDLERCCNCVNYFKFYVKEKPEMLYNTVCTLNEIFVSRDFSCCDFKSKGNNNGKNREFI